jgi:Tol biopolymer transport system component
MSHQPDSGPDDSGKNGQPYSEPELDSALADFTDRLMSAAEEELPALAQEDPELRQLQEMVARLHRALGQVQPDEALAGRIQDNLAREFRRSRAGPFEPSSFWQRWRQRLLPVGWRAGRQRRRLLAFGVAVALIVPFLFALFMVQLGGDNLLGTLLQAPGEQGYPGPAPMTLAALPPGVPPGITLRLSVSATGEEGDHNSWSSVMSADGRYVAFVSLAGNLDHETDNQVSDIFLYDRLLGELRRISRGVNGAAANGNSYNPALSGDGRYLAFASLADNLVAGDLNSAGDVFVYDSTAGTIERVSVGVNGQEADAGSRSPVLSADGRYIAFRSDATNLIAGENNNSSDIFVYDRLSGTTERVSVNSAGEPGNDDSHSPAISADGRFVAFSSRATNLVANDTNNAEDIFLHDRNSKTTARVSVAAGGEQANGHSSEPALSADGRFVAFQSQASNLVANDSNRVAGVFVYNRETGVIERISLNSAGEGANRHSGQPAISADGRIVAFASSATNLAPGTWHGYLSIFAHDRETAFTTRISSDRDGIEANGASVNPSLSADGRFVTFDSVASNLVRQDHNNRVDVFLRDRLPTTHLNLEPIAAEPGVVLLLTGSHFAPDEVATITINGHRSGEWLTGLDGSFVVALITTQAHAGVYYVTVQVNETGQQVLFTLLPGFSPEQPPALLPAVSVPPGIAFDEFVYLPLIAR